MEDYNNNKRIEVTDFIDKKLTDEEMEKIAGTKHFNCILMNPPYSNGSLELKFLQKTIQICDKVVSIQPIEWLQKPADKEKSSSKYNQYKKSILEHISDIERVKDPWKLFDAGFNTDIGIYVCDKDGGYNYDDIVWDVVNKEDYNLFYKSAKSFPKLIEYNENSKKAFVNIKTFANNDRTTRYNIVAPNTYKVIYNQKLPDGNIWNSKKYKSQSLNKQKPFGIYFDTYEEAKNFYNSCLTECFKYIVSVFKNSGYIPLEYLPFMEDYTKPWDNKRFFEYYKINKNKQVEIIEKMKPYMNDNDLIK